MGLVRQSKEKERVIVNASVGLQWFLLDEPWIAREGSRRLFEDIVEGQVEAHAPDRFLDEVIGGLLGALSVGRPTAAGIKEALRELDRLNLRWHDITRDWLSKEVLPLARATQCTFTDAIYVCLALQLNGTLWTSDARFYRNLLQRQRIVAALRPLRAGRIGDYPN